MNGTTKPPPAPPGSNAKAATVLGSDTVDRSQTGRDHDAWCSTVGTNVYYESGDVVQDGATTCSADGYLTGYGGCIYRDYSTVVACNFAPIKYSHNDWDLTIVGACASGLHSYWANGTVTWYPAGGSTRTYPWATPYTEYITC